MQQSIRYLTTDEGVRLAWASMGTGQPVVKAANWLSHLEYDLESPIWRHWARFFGEHYRFVRYDERGCGMTGGDPRGLTLEHWRGDLEAVIDAAGIDGPFALLGISQGAAACIAYAVQHPERISKLVLYGAYARGPYERGNEKSARLYHAIADIARVGWADQNPVFRQGRSSGGFRRGALRDICEGRHWAALKPQAARVVARRPAAACSPTSD